MVSNRIPVFVRVPNAVCVPAMLLAAVFPGCQQVAGVPAHYEPSACQTYCDAALNQCTGSGDTQQIFTQASECMGFCSELRSVKVSIANESDDGVACRTNRLMETEDPATACSNGSPTGGGVCGDICDLYCHLYKTTCSDYCDKNQGVCWVPKDEADCKQQCETLHVNTDPEYDHVRDFTGDTLQCRLLHVVAAIAAKDIPGGLAHCGHAGVNSDDHCMDTAATDCEDYCQIVRVACSATAEYAVFENVGDDKGDAQCKAFCSAMVGVGKRGHNGDGWYRFNAKGTTSSADDMPPDTQDTVGCRRTHSRFAFEDPSSQCPIAGPTGATPPSAGVSDLIACNPDPCESLCDLQKAACNTESPTCVAECNNMSDRNQVYSVASAKQATSEFTCRLLHTMRALTGVDADDNCKISRGEVPCAAD